MGGESKYVKFFRFELPLVLNGEGSKTDLWLVESIKYIDVSKEKILKEYFFIGYHTRGGMTFDMVKRLTIKDYLIVIKEAQRIQKSIETEIEEAKDEMNG